MARKTRNTGKTPRTASASKGKSKRPKTSSGRIARLIKYLAIAIIILGLIPVVLSVVYRFNTVHPLSTLMLSDYVTGQPVKREWVELDEIAPVLLHSVIMSEDGQFCSHRGIDWGEFKAVVENALEGEKTRGASTLTMQTVKNLFLWNSRSYVRKLLEVPLAIWFDFVVPKRRILTIYLNIAEWNHNVYGVQAAAKAYFGKSAKKLSRRQAALLTVTLPDPRGRNAAKPGKRMRRVAGIVERRAKIAGSYVRCLKPEPNP